MTKHNILGFKLFMASGPICYAELDPDPKFCAGSVCRNVTWMTSDCCL